MTIATRQGSPQFPAVSGSIPSSTKDAMDSTVQELQLHKDEWIAFPVHERIVLLEQMMANFVSISPRWVAANLQAKGIAEDAPAASEEWTAGPWPVMRNLHQLRNALVDIEAHGRPRIPGPVTTRPGGQVVAHVFPQTLYDRILFMNITTEIWMEPGVTTVELPQTQAVAYHDQHLKGKVALILGAGNVSSIGPMDILYKLFVENQVVLFKANPINAYLGSLIEESFQPLVDFGFLRITYGGAAEGAYLCKHPGVDEIHITGSDKTFDTIVFGPGPEGAARKVEHQPLLGKRITGELGNVSPVIVIPGPWTTKELDYQAEHIATMLTNNAGFNCNATRVIIQHAAWEQRTLLLQKIRKVLSRVPSRNAYYPGARERHQAFLAAHPEAEQFGTSTGKQLPWTLITGLDPNHKDDVCFTTEAFCSLFAETTIDAKSVPDYIDRAVAFANEHLWGTLNVTLLVHPRSLQNPAVAAALDRAITNLRYGTVAINNWAAASYALAVTTWGAFPGHDIYDIQSGTGVVHNTLMFSRPQKSVLRAPFRTTPTPPWFVTQGNAARKLFPRLVDLEASPSLWKIPCILWSALRG